MSIHGTGDNYEKSSNPQSNEAQIFIRNETDELGEKVENELQSPEGNEKKLNEAEQREKVLIERISDKDNTITKIIEVTDNYDVAIVELLDMKEQIISNYKKELSESKAGLDLKKEQLASLEMTFTDLHLKYEESKHMTNKLKENANILLTEKEHILQSLRLQERRYDKLKTYATQQLEKAYSKIELISKEKNLEIERVKMSVRKEEITRTSLQKQLEQITNENLKLIEICEELTSLESK